MEKEKDNLTETKLDSINIINENEILSDETQESIDGGTDINEQAQTADDWCICNNLTINRTPESR